MTTAPSPPADVRPATAEKSHLEKEGMSFTTEAHYSFCLQKKSAEASYQLATVRKYNTVRKSVRLLFVTTTRLANADRERALPGQETLATENTTTSQLVRCVH
ncbi:hypothetical protein Taro_006756 [Colocasia esculenta]|uniref:Uncharacterized protein n=1 Tax=Colocasia esculenta TaxID=4460 RepID=A0A843TXX2_COLES|nr:hypothetical protein [Colocasia esculenta]